MKKIVIVSCVEDWGGSEELWGRSIGHLQMFGHQITVMKSRINRTHPEFIALAKKGVELIEFEPETNLISKAFRKIRKAAAKVAIRFKIIENKEDTSRAFKKTIVKTQASLVIIAQGINFDGLKLAYECLLLNIPYVIISQKAVDFYWPSFNDRGFMLQALQRAKACFFVSHHNLRLTEEQFGKRLTNAKVVFNPVKLSRQPQPYPSSDPVYKIACVGRLFLLDKGQDILLRILSKKVWRDRPVWISFIGKGNDEQGLKEMAALLNVHNIEFKGQIDDIESMWKDYHALILPSRSEGLPLSMVEAMSAGRPVIISNAGGNAELVEEGITGFIGEANEHSFEEAMERAWSRRTEWQAIGIKGAAYISTQVPSSPETDFANMIQQLLIT